MSIYRIITILWTCGYSLVLAIMISNMLFPDDIESVIEKGINEITIKHPVITAICAIVTIMAIYKLFRVN